MPHLRILRGESIHEGEAASGVILGDAIARMELPLEQPCAGQGTCGKCKVLSEGGLAPPDATEQHHLSAGDLTLGTRLACRARIEADTQVVLPPIIVYSNKNVRINHHYKQKDVRLGLAIDLGSTTVAAYVVTLDDGEISAGSAALNQQTIYGADLISRLSAATRHADNAERLHRLALSSISQAMDGLKLPASVINRIDRVVIVGNVAMHHILTRYPLDSIAQLPFQPHDGQAIPDANAACDGLFPADVPVSLPPLVGGFVGSDALACLAAYDFDRTDNPLACIDLGTNGEVLVTDGDRILTASTAAGPAFEGANISSGSRAVDGAIVAAAIEDGDLHLTTIGDEPPIGLTGSGLLSLVHQLRLADVIEASGRLNPSPSLFTGQFDSLHEARRLVLHRNPTVGLWQWDIRELQKAKAAIRAAIDILMNELGLAPDDLDRFILTGSFGGAVDIDAVLGLGMIPPVDRDRVVALPNGAGMGAAAFLSDAGFARSVAIADRAEQLDLNDYDFMDRYAAAMRLSDQIESSLF